MTSSPNPWCSFLKPVILFNWAMSHIVWLNIVGYLFCCHKVAGSIPDEVIGFFNWSNPSSRTMALGLTQPLTEMSTRNLPGGKERPTRKADKFNAICEPIVYKNVGTSTSHNSMDLHGLLQG
jgi:hypothetical protein